MALASRWLIFWLLFMIGVGGWWRIVGPRPAKTESAESYVAGGYVKFLTRRAWTGYPELVEHTLAAAAAEPALWAPPTQALDLIGAALWREATGWDEAASLRAVATGAAVLLLLLSAGLAWRLAGGAASLATTALMAASPTLIFSAWAGASGVTVALGAVAALWALWEALQAPKNPRRLLLWAVAVAVLMVTGERSLIALVALAAILACATRFGLATEVLGARAAGLCGLLAGLAGLALLYGGVDRALECYRLALFPAGSSAMWHRHLFNLLIVSPLIVLLALGALIRLDRAARPALYLAIFLGVCAAITATLPATGDLRTTAVWEFPLRFLAATLVLAPPLPQSRRTLLAASLILTLSAVEFSQYCRLFVHRPTASPTTRQLLQAVDIVKTYPKLAPIAR